MDHEFTDERVSDRYKHVAGTGAAENGAAAADGAAAGDELSEWLPGGQPVPRRRAPQPERAEAWSAPLAAVRDTAELESEVAVLRAQLARERRRADEAERRAERAEGMEARRAKDATERAGRAADHARQAVAEQHRSEAPEPGMRPASNPGRIDLNSASFESLRSLGLSVTQAARFVAQRDQRGGLRSIDDLDSLFGLPAELKAALKRAGWV